MPEGNPGLSAVHTEFPARYIIPCMSGSAQSAVKKLVIQGKQFLSGRRIPDAVAVANEIIHKHRQEPDGWLLLSEINVRRGKLQDALTNARQALKHDGARADCYAQLARCHTVLQQKHQAHAAAKKAALLDPGDAETLDAVAAILTLCEDQALALPLAEKAVELRPDNPWYLYNLATVQRMTGKLEDAEMNCNKALSLNPEDYRICYTRADLRRQTHGSNHIREMETLLDAGVKQWRGEMMLCFALAKECEDIEAYEKSFSYLEKACDLQRQHIDYQVEDDIETINEIISKHDREAFAQAVAGYESEEPVFIVGLPRTGTTLVERIISSHSHVSTAGELQDFAAVMVKQAQGTGGRQKLTKKGMVEKTLQLDFWKLGKDYIESTRPNTGHTARFIDKLPLNYLYCGLIHASLPKAKIICLQRNAMDTCYAVYRMMFNAAYPFSYDLQDLGRYYIAWRSLMSHWEKTLGDAMLTVKYEDLVDNQERVSRTLIEYCGLDWEDRCLEFYRQESASSTASAVQVRQPLYRSSIGKWKNYARQLEPLAELFREHGIEYE